jgi:hypothetical protein
MKTKVSKQTHDADRNYFPVNYQWSGSDGTICHGHSVAAGRTHNDAERRFFKQNQHVRPDTTDYAYD